MKKDRKIQIRKYFITGGAACLLLVGAMAIGAAGNHNVAKAEDVLGQQEKVMVTEAPQVSQTTVEIEKNAKVSSFYGTPTYTPAVSPTPQAKGAEFNDLDNNCVLRVNSNSKSNPTVSYRGTIDSSIDNNITIPASVEHNGVTYKVTEVADNAFKNMKSLKSITISKNIKKIGKNAFLNCKNLKNITIKTKQLKKVGKKAIKKTNKKLVIHVSSSKLKAYKKMWKGKGNDKAKVKRI